MRAIVTVFKSELRQREFVKGQLQGLCKEIQETDDATILTPKEGNLLEFLNVLRFHKIAYGTHFDNKELEILGKRMG